MTTVLVVERDPYAAEALALLLDSGGIQVAGFTSDSAEALVMAKDRQPDVVLMELSLGGISGIKLIERLREQSPNSKIIIFTDEVAAQDLIAVALTLEPRGLLSKRECSTATLLELIRNVADGRTEIPADILLSAFRSVTATVPRKRERIGTGLSRREIEVLSLVADGKMNKEICDILSISQGTVKTHIYRIFQKLDVGNRTEAVTAATRARILNLNGPAIDGHERQSTPLSG